MRKIYVLAGLLLCSVPVLAQGKKTTEVSKSTGHYTVPITPALPGEEKLSARERVERDLLMPVRRQQAASLTLQEAKQASADITARGVEAAEATTAEEAKKAPRPNANEPHVVFTIMEAKARPAVRKPTTTSRRTSSSRKKPSSSRSTSSARKKSGTSSSKSKSAAVKKKTTRSKAASATKKRSTRRR